MDEQKEELERRRKAFLNYFKKAKIINYIVLFLSVALFIGLFILFHKLDKDLIGLIVCIVIVIGLLAYVKIIKSKINKYTGEYIRKYYEDTTRVLLKGIGIDTFESLAEDEINVTTVSNARVMKDVCYTRSRNIVKFNFDNKEIELGDLLFKTTNPQDAKKPIIAFCGKFMQFKSDKTLEGRTLIYRKAKQENCYGPTDVDGLEKLIDDEKLLVYSSDKNFEKHFTKKTLNILRNIEIDDDLYDVTVAVNGNLISILMSYTDKLMVIPLYEETPIDCFKKAQTDLDTIQNIIKEL
ncbi:MAG: hypothetical protein J1F31_05270 [Erysipelotrichales bacterium]|nr:hypothetical protein [Erysipelotrichales bacterium]